MTRSLHAVLCRIQACTLERVPRVGSALSAKRVRMSAVVVVMHVAVLGAVVPGQSQPAAHAVEALRSQRGKRHTGGQKAGFRA